MKKILSTEKIPVKLWLDDIEEGALEQAKNLANLPFAFHHIAIMPDAHFGYGMPIGGILATEDVVIPNAVGVDIGCGVCAVQTSLTEIEQDSLRTITTAIKGAIPTGPKHHQHKQNSQLMPTIKDELAIDETSVVKREYNKSLTQLGTLGGGNHFIEIQKGSDNHVWIMIHSGSRNLGYRVANHYNTLAVKLNSKWKYKVNPKWQLAHLPTSSSQGRKYLAEMQFCVDFALANRLHMLKKVAQIFSSVCSRVDFSVPINIAHNYAADEKHFGREVIIHRKGAISAKKRQKGIIPGSQGSTSYIVEGKGNSESFCSCSHGAGRKLGRKQAQQILNLRMEIQLLEKQNIIHSLQSKKHLDEATGAYKDIHTVLDNQKDLVDILISLQPLAVIKG